MPISTTWLPGAGYPVPPVQPVPPVAPSPVKSIRDVNDPFKHTAPLSHKVSFIA